VLAATVGPTPTSTSLLTGSTVCPGANCNDDTVSPGVLGFAVVLLMGLAVFFLVRSFRKHIENVPPRFDPPEQDKPAPQ
jgi:hypothetical protein